MKSMEAEVEMKAEKLEAELSKSSGYFSYC